MNLDTGILGETIQHLRNHRRAGTAVSRLLTDLRGQGLSVREAAEHLAAAFCLPAQANVALVPKTPSGEPDPAILDDYIARCVDAARVKWESAGPYPDLMRRRDRIAFQQVARERNIVLIVCAAHPAAARYIGEPGHKPAPGAFLGAVRTAAPNEGLLAADPAAPELKRILNAAAFRGEYARYRAELERQGLRVGPADDGFVIRDDTGAAFYAGYQIHGAYRSDSGANAWTGSDGENIRADLNRRCGEELVQAGPLDIFAGRLELPERDSLRAPQPPVLFFLPDGNVEVRFDARSMELYYRFLGIEWDMYYVSSLGSPEDAE